MKKLILTAVLLISCKTNIYVSFQSGSKIRTVHRQIGIGNKMLSKDSLELKKDTIIKQDSINIIK